MGTQTEVEKIKSAKKSHSCSWCGTEIAPLEPYYRYRWFDGSDASTVKMHEDCMSAMEDEISQIGHGVEFYPGENNRGCYCQKDPSCEYCNSKK